MGLIGILLALAFLITFAYRGWSVLLLAPVAAIGAAALSGQPLLAHWTQTFMGAAAGFIGQFFPLFLLGAVFGKVMEDSGAVRAIADTLTVRLGSERAILAVVLAGAALTYGGVSLFVALFVLAPMAEALFRHADIPRRLMPPAIALGTFTFTMMALPGTPEKVAALDLGVADSMMALGVTPAAVPDKLYLDHLQPLAQAAAPVGTLQEPDLEKLAALGPDLIVVANRSAVKKDAVAQVAPAIDMTVDGADLIGQAKARLAALAALFGRQAEGEALETGEHQERTLRARRKQADAAERKQRQSRVISYYEVMLKSSLPLVALDSTLTNLIHGHDVPPYNVHVSDLNIPDQLADVRKGIQDASVAVLKTNQPVTFTNTPRDDAMMMTLLSEPYHLVEVASIMSPIARQWARSGRGRDMWTDRRARPLPGFVLGFSGHPVPQLVAAAEQLAKTTLTALRATRKQSTKARGPKAR